MIADLNELFAAFDDIESFSARYRRRGLFTFNLSAARVFELASNLEDLPPSVLFDQASSSTFKLVPFPFDSVPVRKYQGRAAVSALRHYTRNAKGYEYFDPIEAIPHLAQFTENFLKALETPLVAQGSSLLVLPRNFSCPAITTPADTFLFLLKGQMCVGEGNMSGKRHLLATVGMALFVPKGCQIGLQAPIESYVLKLVANPLSCLTVVAQYIADRVKGLPQASAPLPGLLLPGPLPPESKAAIEETLVRLKNELTDCDADAVAQVAQRGSLRRLGQQLAPTARGKRRPIPASPYRSHLYDEAEWNLDGLRRRSDDIYIVTFRRSGTTWMQMILFQLLTGQDLDSIEHIYQFSPYAGFELHYSGSAKRIEDLPSPRVIKTHLPFRLSYSPTGKYIYVARDGLDVIVSGYFHHLEMGNGNIPFDVYFDRMLREHPSWFEHVLGWWKNRLRPNVLFLTFRELKDDFVGSIKKIADFCDVPLRPEQLPQIQHRCSIEYMKRHERKFHHLEGLAWLSRQQRGQGFIRTGEMGSGRDIVSESLRARFAAKYEEVLSRTNLNLSR